MALVIVALQGLPAALVSPIFGEFLDIFNGDGHPDSALCKLILRLTTMLSGSYKSTDTAGCCKISQRMLGEDYKGRSTGGEQRYTADLTDLLAELLHVQIGGSHPIVPSPASRVGQPQLKAAQPSHVRKHALPLRTCMV